jgi:cobalt-zinc-cadmium resistance protein CzcA
MSLGALDFGLLVDGAVIIVEAVLHRLQHEFRAAGRNDIVPMVEQTASRLLRAAIFGQIIILIVYVPVLTLQGIEGKMFRPMAWVLLFALGGAFLLSMTYVPAIVSLVFARYRPPEQTVSDRIVAWLERWYRPVLRWALRRPALALGISAALLLAAVVGLTRLGGEFIPKLEEGDFAVDTRLLTGSSLHMTVETTQRCARVLLDEFPEVIKVVTKIGSAEIPTDPMPIEASDMMVVLKPKEQWQSADSYDALAERMYERLSEAVPGVTFGFQFPVQMRFNELMTGARQDVVCKIFGDDLDTLAALADRLATIASTIPGARDIYRERMLGMPQIVVRYNRAALARYGITIEEANRTISTAFAGAPVGTFYEGERRFDVVVRLDSNIRSDPAVLRMLQLRAADGQLIPLGVVADITSINGPNQIQRESARRRIIVGFNVRGRDVESVVEDLARRVQQSLRLPPGYEIRYGGTFENLQHARARLAISVPIALASILVLLYAAFGSVRHALLIFSAVPLATIGGVAGLVVRGMPFSVSAGVGFIALFGVAVLNGVVLTAEFNRRRQHVHLLRAIMEATHTRFRPVILTAAVAALGFLPMALSTRPGSEVQRPLATVVIGGLVSATLLTLVLLPVLYGIVERWHQRRRAIQPATGALVVIGFAVTLSAHAQEPISLERAFARLDSVHPDRMRWQSLVRQTEYERDSWLTLAPLQVALEYGQLNTAANDSRITAQLPLQLPPIHRARRALLDAQHGEVLWGNQWDRMLRRAELAKLAYQVHYWAALRAHLDTAAALLERAVQLAGEQVERGSSTRTLQATVALQYATTLGERESARAQYETALRLFNRYLGSDSVRYVPALDSLTAPPDLLTSATDALRAQARTRIDQASALRDATSAELLPTFTLGYSNTTFIGYQNIDGVDRYYGPSTRFSSIGITLGIPLPTPWAQARLRAASERITVANWQYEATLWDIAQQQLRARQRLLAAQAQRQVLERHALNAASIITSTADAELRTGAVSLLEWTLALQQALSVRRSYLDAVWQYNDALIDVELLGN